MKMEVGIMDIFTLNWIGLIITGLGTLFLIGEILVNMRGVFAILGVGFIIVYFCAYLEPGCFIFMFIVYFVVLLLIFIDGRVLTDGTRAILGLVGMLIAVALAAPNFNAGMYAVCGVLLGGGASFLLLKFFKRREMWSKIALKDQLTKEAGYNSMNAGYEALVGKEGITLNDLRPVGTIRIDDKDYSAISNGQWISKNSTIQVIQVDGTRILVESKKE